MIKNRFLLILWGYYVFVGILVFPTYPLVAATSLIITDTDITWEKQEPLVGQSVRIYAKIANRGGDDLKGIVKFFDGTSKQIGTDQPFSVLKDKQRMCLPIIKIFRMENERSWSR